MIFEWFLLGTFAFWVLFLVFTLIFILCAENDGKSVGATVVATVVFLLFLVLAGDLAAWFSANYWRLLYVLAWPLVGLAWSFPKWIIFLRQTARDYGKLLKAFISRRGLSEDPKLWNEKDRENFADDWALQRLEGDTHLNFNRNTGALTAPDFQDNVDRVVVWVLLWPWSMLWTAIRDGVIRATRWVVETLGVVYQRISDWAFKDFT